MGEPQQKVTGLSDLMVEISLNDCQSIGWMKSGTFQLWVVPLPSCEMLRAGLYPVAGCGLMLCAY